MAEPVAVEPRVPVRNNATGKTGTIALSEYQLRQEEFTPLNREEHQRAKFAASQTDEFGEQVLAGAEGAFASGSMGFSDYWAARNMAPDEFEEYRARRASDVSQNVETGTDIVTAVAGGLGGLGKATVGTAVKQGVKAETKAAVRGATKELAEEGVERAVGSQADDALVAIAAETGNSPLGKALSRRIVDGAVGTVGAVPSAMATRGATLAGEAVETGLTRAGLPTVGKAAGLATEGVTEAARQRVSDNLSEASLGGEDITAERLFAGVADDAMLWGGVGAGLGLAGGALGAGRGALEQFASKRAAKAKALIPEAGVIDEARQAGFMPPDKVVEASAALSGHSKDDIRKIFGNRRIAVDHANQKVVRGDLREQFRKAFDDAHEYAAVERSLLAGEFKAANVAKTVRRGPDVWPAAESQVRSVTEGLLSKSDIIQREMTEAFGKSEFEGLRRIASVAEDRMRKAIKAGDESEAYLAIENLKRDLDAKAKTAETVLARGGNRGTRNVEQVSRLRQYAEEEAHRVRRFLEDEEVWGQAGRNQRVRNEAATEMIGPSADMRSRFVTELREGAESLPGAKNTYGARKISYADPSKIDSYLGSLSDTGSDVVHAQTRRYFDAREKFLKTVLDNGEVPPDLVDQFQKALAATQKARSTVSEAGQRMADINVLNDMLTKENAAAQAQFGALPSIGIGFATGGVRGALGEAANVVTGRALARPASIAARMAVVESTAQRVGRVDQTVASKVKAIARKAAHGVKRGVDAAGKVGRVALRAAPAAHVALFGREPEERRKSVEKRMKRVLEMHADPILSLRHGGEITRGMADSAPAVTAAVVRKHMTALDFIASKAKPAIELNASALQPHLTKRRYTDQQIRELAQMLTVIERPLSLLDDLETGNVNALQVETMKAVWPELFEDIRLKLITEMGATKEPLPYSATVQLSLMLGIAGHPTMDPAFIARHNQRFAAEDEAKNQQIQNPAPPPNSTERLAAAEAGMNLADKIARSL